MPFYDYFCKLCTKKTNVMLVHDDILRSIKDDSPEPCPLCKGPMTRLFSRPAIFDLKGGGWAKDGYHKKPEKKVE